jgi:hypothetical protein
MDKIVKENILREVFCLSPECSLTTFHSILKETFKSPIDFYKYLVNISFFKSIWQCEDNNDTPVIIYANYKIDADGLSQIAKRFIKMLRYKGLTICDFEFCSSSFLNIERLKLIIDKVGNPKRILFVYHGTWNADLYSFLDYLGRVGVKKIGYLTWETTLLPVTYIGAYNLFDTILVPSEFNKLVFEKSLKHDCKIVPHIFLKCPHITTLIKQKFSLSHKEITILILNNSNDCRKNFLQTSVWTMEWIISCVKNIPPLMKKRDYKLIIKGFKGQVMQEIRRLLGTKEYSILIENASVILLDNICNNEEIATLHKQSHIYVSLTHGEGVGMNVIDAAIHGNIVVVPQFGGYVDYLGEDYPFYIPTMIKHIGSPELYGSFPSLQKSIFHDPQKWAFVEKEMFFQTMTKVIRLYDCETDTLYMEMMNDTLRKVGYYTNIETVGNRYIYQIKKTHTSMEFKV